MIANPIFDKIDEFLDLLLAAVKKNKDTRALFVVPYRANQLYQRRLETNQFCKLVAQYAVGADVFSSATKENPLSERRDNVNGSNEQIQIWEICQKRRKYSTCNVKDFVDLGRNLVQQFASGTIKARKGLKGKRSAKQREVYLEARKATHNEQAAICKKCRAKLTNKRMAKHNEHNCPHIKCDFCDAIKSNSRIQRHMRGCLEGPWRKCAAC